MILKENLPILEETNVDKWHDKGYTGKGVTIALLDDGGLPREHMKSYYTNINNPGKDAGHSTNVGFSAHQAAPDARVVALNAKSGSDDAFSWLEAHRNEIDVINISLAGIGGSLANKYLKLENLGIPVVCAAGNDSFENKISYPAKYDFTIAIGAWVWRNDSKASYSNAGPDLDAVAPSGIYMQRDDGYKWSVIGTSFASPIACGMLACYIQWRKENGLPKLTQEEARAFIHDNCIDVYDEGFDYDTGHGLFYMPDPSSLRTPKPQPVEPKPQPEEPEPEQPKNNDTFFRVVTGSFGSRLNAAQRMDVIKAKGFDSFLLPYDANGKIMYRVITGSFTDRNNANQRIDELKQAGFDSFIAIYKK